MVEERLAGSQVSSARIWTRVETVRRVLTWRRGMIAKRIVTRVSHGKEGM